MIGALLILLALQKCSKDSEINDLISDKDKVTSFYHDRDSVNLAKINSQAQDIVSMKQSIVDDKVVTESLKKELKGYKEASLVETRIVTRIDSFRILLHDTVVVDSARLAALNCEYADSLLKEFKKKQKFFTFSDNWFTMSGKSSYKEVSFDSLTFKNEFDVILGYKREKWYKRSYPVVELKSYNPYSKITYVNNIVVKDKRSKFEKTMLSKPAMLVYGLIAGIIITKNN